MIMQATYPCCPHFQEVRRSIAEGLKPTRSIYRWYWQVCVHIYSATFFAFVHSTKVDCTDYLGGIYLSLILSTFLLVENQRWHPCWWIQLLVALPSSRALRRSCSVQLDLAAAMRTSAQLLAFKPQTYPVFPFFLENFPFHSLDMNM
jgi:hypothetical protein